ncbi:MAG: hypothetical protein KDK89_05885 [Alphaproteobacteria bacterium]|nr:hypothetical protein [Alphaproteobacteria bacterium]
MKTIKLALLGGAALAVMAAGAQADDLSDLKAQIESLNARVAQMEAAPAVPAGYQLLTVSEGSQPVIPGLDVLRKDALAMGNKATVIGILPTADAPASTEITWSGYARAAVVYQDWNSKWYDQVGNHIVTFEDDGIDVYARGQIKVTGKTDTAVGEVGATIEMRGNLQGHRGAYDRVYIEQAWGWWAMTPELTLGGGFAGSLANVGYGYDGACNCYYTDNADVAFNPGDTSQMRLTYGSGPFEIAMALEDAGNSSASGSDLGVTGRIKWSGDTLNGSINGGYWNGTNGIDDAYQIGAGVGFALGDMASISIGAAAGHTHFPLTAVGWPVGCANPALCGSGEGANWWGASILGSVNLSDSVHAELAYGYKRYGNDNTGVVNVGIVDSMTNHAILGGIYYDPVSQLTIGLEGEWTRQTRNFVPTIVEGKNKSNLVTLDLVTVFRF